MEALSSYYYIKSGEWIYVPDFDYDYCSRIWRWMPVIS